MTREEAIDIRSRSLNRQPVSMAELDEAMRVIKSEATHTAPANKWGLPVGMCATLSAMVRTGDAGEAARELGVGRPAVSMALTRAVERMGVRNRMLALFEWDRAMRGMTQ
jgi:hypothetical protein